MYIVGGSWEEMRWLLIIFILILLHGGISAYRIEQKIDMINTRVSTTSSTYTPTTGTSGIINWNISAYDNVYAVYYESMADYDFSGSPDSSGSGFTRLYSNTNNTNASRDVSLAGSPTIKNSENLTFLFKNGLLNLSIQVKAGTSSTANVWGARLVIVQDGNITKTVTYIPLGFSGVGNPTNSTPLSEISDPKRWTWNSSDFGGNVTVFFSSTFYRSSLSGNAYVSLLDLNTSVDINGTRWNLINASPIYNISSNITDLLTNGDILSVGWGSENTSVNVIQRNAFLIVKQININASNPVLTIPVQIENVKRIGSSIVVSYDSTVGTEYNGSNWQGINMTHYADYTYKSSNNSVGDLALAKLRLESTDLGTSQDTTNSLNYSYRRKSFNFGSNETAIGKLDSGIYNLNAPTTNTTLSSSRFIIKINNVNSCNYLGNNWSIDCNERCNITSTINLNRSKINISGVGFTYISGRIFNYSDAIIQKCEVVIYSGGSFG